MNRTEFMTELAALLQDIPVEERREAMQYYNDYFDDAGPENEQQVIDELESPKKVAANIKADMKENAKDRGEFTENGYSDPQFREKEMPAGRYEYQSSTESPKTNNAGKLLLIIAVIVIGAPIVLPLAGAAIATVLACLAAAFGIFLALVGVAVALAIMGIVLVVTGITLLIPHLAVGLGLIGTGLILTVIGVIGTVAAVKICITVFPGICRGIVWICRRPFERKAVS